MIITTTTPPRELEGYNMESTTAPAASVGKCGHLSLGFELDNSGRSILRQLERHTPLLVQQGLYFDEQLPQMPCIYIVSTGGPNVEGDRYEQHFTLKKGAMAHISTAAATKLAQMRNNYSSLHQSIVLEAGAYLEYLPEPTIPCANTRYYSLTEITIHPSATLFYSEIFTSGRRHSIAMERFEYDLLSITCSAHRPTGKALFRDKFIAKPKQLSVQSIGAMADYDIYASIILLSEPQTTDKIYQQSSSFIDTEKGVAMGVSRLPSECGVLFRILGKETQPVKQLIREICSQSRVAVKGVELPEEFPWR